MTTLRRFVLLALCFGLTSGLSSQTLVSLALELGVHPYFEPYRQVVVFSTSAHRLVIDLQTGTALGDGVRDFSLSSLDPVSGKLSRQDFEKVRTWWREIAPTPPVDNTSVSAPQESTHGRRIQVLVLDAGHGGSDPGSIGKHTIDGKSVTLREKDLTLAVVLELQKLLVATYPDRNIVLTRKDDTYPTLERRVQIAHAQRLKEGESIFFLSVHFNASLSSKARGLELWYVPHDYERDVLSDDSIPDTVFSMLNSLVDTEYKKESRDLAVSLAKGLATTLGDSESNVQRGLKENPWFVVRMARMPAVLAELGFITNPDDARLLQDPEYLKKLAKGLYTGLCSFIQSYEDPS